MRAEQRARRDAFLDRIGSRPVVMGILNLTPDSFSDGGLFPSTEAAVSHAQRMAAQGANIVDVGAESTRPGATPVPASEELARIEPVLAALVPALDTPISIDTYKATTAARAVALGAVLVNDVWGLQKDPAMADTVADSGAALVIMHNRLEKDPGLDILDDIRGFFERSLKLAIRAGIP
jgi:dihydropteroate synthase